MDSAIAPEARANSLRTAEAPRLVVCQPQKLETLLGTLDLIEKISERIGEDRSGDWSGSGTGAAQQGSSSGTRTVSPRDQAIASLPRPVVLQRRLQRHIRQEVKTVHREIRQITNMRKPGAAYRLNVLYARLRQLNNLLHELLHSTGEILKRLYIRVFIDKQPLLQ